jgi:hypothetical protein
MFKRVYGLTDRRPGRTLTGPIIAGAPGIPLGFIALL